MNRTRGREELAARVQQAIALLLYTDEDLDEMIAAQNKFIDAAGFERETVQ